VRERNLFLGAIVALGLVAAGIIVATQADLLLPGASTRAVLVDELFRVLLGISTVIFLLVEGALVYAIIRFRRRAGDDADGPPIHGNASLEILWTLIPAAIVVIIGVYSFQVLQAVEVPGSRPIVVEVVGRQFAWEFRYPAENLTSSELHLPVNEPVLFQITSEDVIHSFWIPDFRAKRDATPGQVSALSVTPNVIGRFPIRCAELCGAGHAVMTSEVVVESRSDYEAWLAARAGMANEPTQIFADFGCGGCHTLSTVGATGIVGPSLDGIGTTAATRVSGLAARDYLEESIVQPDAFIVPGFQPGLMPKDFGSRMTPEQLQALVEFLEAQS
jgi:cytochrome c oxidase subunit 2